MENVMPNAQAPTIMPNTQPAAAGNKISPAAGLAAARMAVFCLLSVFCLPLFAQDSGAQKQIQKEQERLDTQERVEALKQIEDINLRELVPKTRMEKGQRAIFEPRSVRFSAKLSQMPTPQKAEYLNKVLGMMGFANPPAVSQRIVIEYGGDKPLAAYVENRAAAHIAKEGKAGEEYQFHALYVYNNSYGPALVVTAFSK
jgi:hypothetical protein